MSSQAHPLQVRTYDAGAKIAQYRVVKHGDEDGKVIQAAADTDKLIGVALRPAPKGERIDVVTAGVAAVEYGAAVTRGDLLTANGDGKAVAETVAGKRIIGVADVSGKADDIGRVLLSPGSV